MRPAAPPAEAAPRRAGPLGRVASRVASRAARLGPPARIAGVDLARGLAVIGVFAAHLAVISPLEWGDPGTWSGLVEGRSAVLFAMLAGVSLGIVSVAAERRRLAGAVSASAPLFGLRAQLLLRGVLLWLLGIWLDDLEVPVYVILPAYGALFVLAIPFTRLAPRALFALSAALALGAPFAVQWIDGAVARSDDPLAVEESLRLIAWNYPLPLWLAFLLCGMAAGALLMRSRRYAWPLLGAGVLLAALGYGVVGSIARAAEAAEARVFSDGSGAWWAAALSDAPHGSGVGEALGSGGFALAVTGAAVLLCLTPLRWIALPLRAVGSMPLTAYVVHIGIWAVWIAVETARDPGLDPSAGFRALEPFWPTTAGVIAGCTLWALTVGQGPLEWLLGAITKAPARWNRR